MHKNKFTSKPNFEVVYRGKMFEILEWEGKPGIKFEAAIRAPGVRLLIETEKNGMKALLMTSEFRREVDDVDYRLPGGKVFDSLEEFDNFRISEENIISIAEMTARKEGKEEAGVDGGLYELVSISKAGASVEWDLYYFRVTNANIGKQNLTEEELGDIEIVILSAEEIFNKLSKGEIKEGRTADLLWVWLKDNGFIEFKK